jgi:hypothetical protein
VIALLVHQRRDEGSGERRRGVELPAEDDRYATGRHVTHHAAADAAEHAEGRCGEDTQPGLVRLDRARHAEQRETHRVEHHDLSLHAAECRVEREHRQRRHGRHDEIAPVVERGRRHRADHDVAEHPAAEARDEREDHDPEDVELLADRDQRSGRGEYRDSGQIEDQEQGVGHGDDAIWSRRVTAGSHPARLG